MAVVDVKDLHGKTVGQLELADAVFAATVNPYLLHETVRWYLAGQRAGTHKTKGRGEVAGSGRKLWRQKGTGRARVGSIRSSIWRKGGTVHGPQPRDYSYRLPRKMVAGALRSALSAKLADEKLTVVDGFALESHKTKEFRLALSRLDGDTRTILVVEAPGNRNLELASRNLEGVKVVAPAALQPYDLLRHGRVMLSKDAALRLGRSLGPESGRNAEDANQAATSADAAAAPQRAAVGAPATAAVARSGKTAKSSKAGNAEASKSKKAAPAKAAASKPRAASKSAAKPKKGKE
jgi:large subunit ribosomal protein L4